MDLPRPRFRYTGLQRQDGRPARLRRNGGPARFVTVFYAFLDVKERTFTSVNAGHCRGLLFRADGTIREPEPTGPVIGLGDDPAYRAETLSWLQPGRSPGNREKRD